jgi:hypothetical protein
MVWQKRASAIPSAILQFLKKARKYFIRPCSLGFYKTTKKLQKKASAIPSAI